MGPYDKLFILPWRVTFSAEGVSGNIDNLTDPLTRDSVYELDNANVILNYGSASQVNLYILRSGTKYYLARDMQPASGKVLALPVMTRLFPNDQLGIQGTTVNNAKITLHACGVEWTNTPR
jgi:hypothetical protein